MPGSCKRRTRPWSGTEDVNRSCPSVASYLDFYTNIPDYSDLHELSDGEFYERLQALKAAQKRLASDASDLEIDRPCSQTSVVTKTPECARAENESRKKSPPRIVVQSPMLWDRKSPSCQTPVFNHYHQREMCRSMGALSLDSSNLHIHGEPCIQPCRRPTNKKKSEQKHEIPLLSRIPLFHKIMAEQEERRRLIHERNSRELQALVQPFSFTKKEEAVKHLLSAYANPGSHCHGHGRPETPFKARPVPKQLFSDRAYDRMREEQFYRALKKRIRADEMLRNAKMPPSMEAREKISNKGKSKSLDYLSGKKARRQRSGSRCNSRGQEEDSAASWENSWCRQAPTKGRSGSRCRGDPYKARNGSWMANSNTDSSSPNDSTLGVPGPSRSNKSRINVSRGNLASVLRTQTARNRMERKLKDQLEEEEQRERSRFKARLVRLSPAWRTLDYSTDEDLALRLAQRRQEAKRQTQHHRRMMEDIHGRVHHIPPLFQEPDRVYFQDRCNISKGENRSKSLESSLDSAGLKAASATPRKSHSFHLDRRLNNKSSDSSQAKSDASKEDFCDSDVESHFVQEADAEEQRQRREREQKKKQDVMTLGETNEEIIDFERRLADLTEKKHQLFLSLKKVLNEDDNRRRQAIRENTSELISIGANYSGMAPPLFLQPLQSRLPVYKVPPSPSNVAVAGTGPGQGPSGTKRQRSPSPPSAQAASVHSYHPYNNYKSPSFSQHKQEDGRRNNEYVRAVLWNKGPAAAAASYASVYGGVYNVAPSQPVYSYPGAPSATYEPVYLPRQPYDGKPDGEKLYLRGHSVPMPVQASKAGSISAGYPVRASHQPHSVQSVYLPGGSNSGRLLYGSAPSTVPAASPRYQSSGAM